MQCTTTPLSRLRFTFHPPPLDPVPVLVPVPVPTANTGTLCFTFLLKNFRNAPSSRFVRSGLDAKCGVQHVVHKPIKPTTTPSTYLTCKLHYTYATPSYTTCRAAYRYHSLPRSLATPLTVLGKKNRRGGSPQLAAPVLFSWKESGW